MSFHEITGKPATIPVSADDFPRFIISDVTGDCLGLFQLGKELQRAMGDKGQVYLWHDPMASEAGQNLDTYAEKIADEIIEKQPSGPIYLSGFSWGCALARVTAQKLTAKGRQVAFYGIDSPSIEGSQTYLHNQNPAATQDLYHIFKYAAELAQHHSDQKMEIPVFDEPELTGVCARDFEEQITYFTDRFLQAAKDKKLNELFTQYAAKVRQNLLSLLHYKGKAGLDPLDKIGLFFSSESEKKFGFDVAKSWATSGHKGEVSFLPGSRHLSLLRNKASCRTVAEKMANFFRIYFSPEAIMTMLFSPWVASNPSLKLSDVFRNLDRSSKPQEPKDSTVLGNLKRRPAPLLHPSHAFAFAMDTSDKGASLLAHPSPLSSPFSTPLTASLDDLEGAHTEMPDLSLAESSFPRSAPMDIPGKPKGLKPRSAPSSLQETMFAASPSDSLSSLNLGALADLPMDLTKQPQSRKEKRAHEKLKPTPCAFFGLPQPRTRLQEKRQDDALLLDPKALGMGYKRGTPVTQE